MELIDIKNSQLENGEKLYRAIVKHNKQYYFLGFKVSAVEKEDIRGLIKVNWKEPNSLWRRCNISGELI